MSTITKPKKIEITDYERFIKCDYCGKEEPKAKVPTKLVNWATITVQTEYNSFFHTDMCPFCVVKKGIKIDHKEG